MPAVMQALGPRELMSADDVKEAMTAWSIALVLLLLVELQLSVGQCDIFYWFRQLPWRLR